MRLAFPIIILRHENCIAAVAVVVDGLDPEFYRITGDDDRVDSGEARRIVTALISLLVDRLEIAVSAAVQQEAFRLAACPDRWCGK